MRDALLLSLLRMPMTWFSLVATWFICFDHSKQGYKRTPRYFTVSVCINLFLSRINLRLGSVFLEPEWKLINSVFVILRDDLIAVNHWDKFKRSRFIRFAKVSGELCD